MKLSTHWAYYYFLSHLLEGDAICSSLTEAEPFYMVGDSHVLSSSWRDMSVQGRQVFVYFSTSLILLSSLSPVVASETACALSRAVP